MNEMRKATPDATALPAPEAAPAKPGPAPGRTGGEGVGRAARLPFRRRLVAILFGFALVPMVLVALVWVGTANRALSLADAGEAWDRVGRSGEQALSAIDRGTLTPAQREALAAHEEELRRSVELGKRAGFVASRTIRIVAFVAVVVLLLVAWGASRVAGHLARQLSRPVDELVGWTARIRAGEALPDEQAPRGAPEFETLRAGMRSMALALEQSRRQAIAAERAEAYRESARRFAHELKNPLTPIRFAVDRLRRGAADGDGLPAPLAVTVDVLAEETARLEAMAKSFAQFGRLPDGPAADVDVAELITRFVPPAVPPGVSLTIHADEALPHVRGHHDALARAVGNVVGNAVEAMDGAGTLSVTATRDTLHGAPAVRIAVHDSGPGVPEALRDRLFEPYVTAKPGGTGLGLAIVQQTVAAHGGAVAIASGAETGDGIGTEVRLVLPAASAGSPVAPSDGVAPAAPSGTRPPSFPVAPA